MITRRLVLLALVASTLATAAPVRAAGTLIVDTGQSRVVQAGEQFVIEGTIEGDYDWFEWVTESGSACTALSGGSLTVTASCEEPGIDGLTLVAGAADGTRASDRARMVVRREYAITVGQTSGHASAGLPDEAAGGSGAADGQTQRVPLEVPENTVELKATLDWTVERNDFDLRLELPDGSEYLTGQGRYPLTRPERVTVDGAQAGTWTALVQPKVSVPDDWSLTAVARVIEGDVFLPSVLVPATDGTLGELVTLRAQVEANEPYEILWESDLGSIAFDDGQGETFTFTLGPYESAKVKVIDALGLETVATAYVRLNGSTRTTSQTVVAVIDSGFSPYHYDFLGHQHPYNLDADPINDLDFTADPSTYIDGYPGAERLDITIPTTRGAAVGGLAAGQDKAAWDRFRTSSPAAVNMYWLPGTKIVGAVSFGGAFSSTNSSHGTRSAASAVGNIHGTCPECLVVLVNGLTPEALEWVANQSWIDVVTNSYGHSTTPALRDNIYFGSPVDATRAASQAGQTIVFSAGNGLANAYDVPMFTYWSSEKGPDWMVTVGAVSNGAEQTYLGHGKPVDISSIGDSYPSTGGTTATGTGTHSGTSNAAPTTAGIFGKVLHESRMLLGDVTVQHADGVIASGSPVACGPVVPTCVLGDGILTHGELRNLVFHNVLPSPMATDVQTIPTTQHAYYYQGHGVISGRSRGTARYDEQWTRMVANARGDLAAYERPDGERNWFAVDSDCRQRLWGRWTGGYFTGQTLEPDLQTDPIAHGFQRWCSKMSYDTFGPLYR